MWPFTVDDTFITLRYARHLAEGYGATWNPHEAPIEGYTSVLWMLVLVVPHWLDVDPHAGAKVLSVASAAVVLPIAAAIVGRTGTSAAERRFGAAAIVFALACVPGLAVHAVSGMETALGTALVTAYLGGCVWLGRLGADVPKEQRRLPTAVLGSTVGLGLLASLTRPEANLLCGVTTLALLPSLPPAERRRLLIFVAAIHVIPGALYFGWRVVHYGQWLPLPFYVKATEQAGMLAGLGEALAFSRDITVARWYVFVPLVFACALSPGRRRWWAPLAGVAAWCVFTSVPAHLMGYDARYSFPVLPFLLCISIAGWVELASKLRLGSGVAHLLVAICFVAGYLPGIDAIVREKVDYGRGLHEAHVALGRALAERTAESGSNGHLPTVAALDSGAIAYYSRWRAIDTFGLNDPVIATTGRRDPAYVLDRRPEVVVVVSAEVERFVPHFEYEEPLRREALDRGYVHAATYTFLPDYHLWVLARPGVLE